AADQAPEVVGPVHGRPDLLVALDDVDAGVEPHRRDHARHDRTHALDRLARHFTRFVLPSLHVDLRAHVRARLGVLDHLERDAIGGEPREALLQLLDGVPLRLADVGAAALGRVLGAGLHLAPAARALLLLARAGRRSRRLRGLVAVRARLRLRAAAALARSRLV